MRKIYSLLFLVCLFLFLNTAFAQPGLKQMQLTQQKESAGGIATYSIEINPKNKSLGSVLLSAGTNIALTGSKQWLSSQLQLRPGVDELRKIAIPGTYPEMQLEKFGQYFKGIRVEHGMVNAAGKAGRMGLVQMEFYAIPDNFIITPAISEEVALQKAMKYARAKKYVWEGYKGNDPAMQKPMGELVIVKDYFSPHDTICLAYKFLIRGSGPTVNTEVFVNAMDAALALSNNNVANVTDKKTIEGSLKYFNDKPRPPLAAAETLTILNNKLLNLSFSDLPAQAATLYSGTQTIYTDLHTDLTPPFASYYRLNQSTNGYDITTQDFHNNSYSNFLNIALADDIKNQTNDWTIAGVDKTALEAYFNMQVLSDYWKTKHNRTSYDNLGAPMYTYVHADVGRNCAAWTVSNNFSYKGMYFGDGSYQDGIIDESSPHVGLDITAHEMGHAIAKSPDMPQFVSAGEAGVLNEGFSDIWGACIENYGVNRYPSSTNLKATWLIAEESISSHGSRGLRNLQDPKSKDQPDTYQGDFYADEVPDADYKHMNSSILTKWFSLITAGGTGTNDRGYTYNVNSLGFGFDITEKIAYNTELLLTPNASFNEVMRASINYVTATYAISQPNIITEVTEAWRAVGVLDILSFTSTNTPGLIYSGNAFNCIAVGKDGYVWAGTPSPSPITSRGKSGLFRYNGVQWKRYDIPADSSSVLKVSYRDIKADKKGGIWIAQSGYSGVSGSSNSTGGVFYFNDTTLESKKYYTSSSIAYKRNTISRCVTSLWVDTTKNNAGAESRGKDLPQVWITSQAQTTASIGTSGGVAMGLTDTVYTSPDCCTTIPYDSNFLKVATPYLTNVDNRTTLRGSQTVGGNSQEVWVYSDANTEVSLVSWGFGTDFYNGSPQQIISYDASTGDSLGAYNFSNTPIMGSFFTVKAIYFDKNNNKWLGLANYGASQQYNCITMQDKLGNWHNRSTIVAASNSTVTINDIFPTNTTVNNNAVAGDKDGNVYIGTNNGLIIYSGGESPLNGTSPIDSIKSYKRYTVSDGLPSNMIRGIAIDTLRKGIWLATDNGIALWRFDGRERAITITNVNTKHCNRQFSYSIATKGKFFDSPTPNILTLELSDGNGSFINPTFLKSLGYVTSENVFTTDTIYLPLTIANGNNYQLRAKTTNPVFTSTLSRPFSIKKPVAIIPSAGALTYSANRECTDNNKWTHYYYNNGTPNDESDDIRLLSIKKNDNNIGNVDDASLVVTVGSTIGAGSNTGIDLNNNPLITNPYVTMNRFWKVTPATQPVTPVGVRFYYNTQDLQDVNGTVNYPHIDHTGLVFSKVEGGNPDPSTNFLGATNIVSYVNGTTATLTPAPPTWVYRELTPTMHQAEFLVNHFSGGTGGSTPDNGPLGTLPLQLIGFTAKISNAKTLLQWQTSAEINTDHFEILRSSNGREFFSLGNVTAAGNSSTQKNYSFTDAQPFEGKNYYRLKMVDIDGKTTYSQVKVLTFSKNGTVISIYPNPANNLLNIENNLAGKQLQVTITDISGRQLMQWEKTNAPLIQLPINTLATGTYLLKISDGVQEVNNKLVKE